MPILRIYQGHQSLISKNQLKRQKAQKTEGQNDGKTEREIEEMTKVQNDRKTKTSVLRGLIAKDEWHY